MAEKDTRLDYRTLRSLRKAQELLDKQASEIAAREEINFSDRTSDGIGPEEAAVLIDVNAHSVIDRINMLGIREDARTSVQYQLRAHNRTTMAMKIYKGPNSRFDAMIKTQKAFLKKVEEASVVGVVGGPWEPQEIGESPSPHSQPQE